jgi:soluble lytic murein transglycosylase-like protein
LLNYTKLLMILLMWLALVTFPAAIHVPPQLTQDELISLWSNIRKLDEDLVRAIIWVESKGNRHALGDNKTTYGLMQIGHSISRAYGCQSSSELYEVNVNLMVGTGFLKKMIDKYGVKGGVQAYNLGETKYRRGVRNLRYYNRVRRAYGRTP